jgi:hypothetical protein
MISERFATRFQKKLVCWTLIALTPAYAASGDPGRGGTAFALAYGNVLLNGTKAPIYSPIFSGDSLRTTADSQVRIGSSGSSVTVQPYTLVTFHGEGVILGNGTVEMSTSRKMAAQAGDVTIVPAQNVQTEFEVARLNGVVQIFAKKGDLALSSGTETTRLAEGEQATEEEPSTGGGGRPAQAVRGKFVKKRYVIAAAIAAGVAIGIWEIVDATSGSSRSISPTTP